MSREGGHRQILLTEQENKNDIRSVQQENKFIRRQNELLRKQLENISLRLDGEIKKRLEEQKKKPSAKPEDVSQMQLQNAYKKCQIYKKEVSYYKKKLQAVPDLDRLDQLEKKMAEIVKENDRLRDQLKQVKRISKLQEKGLSEVGAEGYLKLVNENQKLKEEVRILKKQNDDERRGRMKHLKTKTETQEFNTSKVDSKITEKDIKIQQQVKRRRIRTQSNNQVGGQQDLTEALQVKMQKDYAKIKALMSQKTKLRDMVDNLKGQLAEKQKQLAIFRQKVTALRKNNQLLQVQAYSRLDGSAIPQEDEIKNNKFKKSRLRLDQSSNKKRVWKKQGHSDSQVGEDTITASGAGMRYPRKQERGSRMQNTIKWNDQNLSSKIKQLHLFLHELGHIKAIHAKYQKGQPKQYDAGKAKNLILSCPEDQFIRYIKGKFIDGYLQYIIVTTNRKRVEKFGRWTQFENQQQGQAFEFEVGEGQYPGGLFGQSDNFGVRRLGCFIHKQG